MKKTFDAVEMKRKAQEKIYEETKNLSREEELEYFHKGGEKFWCDIDALRAKKKKADQGKQCGIKSQKKRPTEGVLKSKS
jgi:hypothetical protein